jgi:hypothetical protein
MIVPSMKNCLDLFHLNVEYVEDLVFFCCLGRLFLSNSACSHLFFYSEPFLGGLSLYSSRLVEKKNLGGALIIN